MLEQSQPFSSFSTNDISLAKYFYSDVLGLRVTEETPPGCPTMLTLHLNGGGKILIYPKEDHVPATHTVLNFPVKDFEQELELLKEKGLEIEVGETSGPQIAWFKDPAGNYLSLLKEEELEREEGFTIKRFLPSHREDLFQFWTEPELIERWAFPEGMSLKVSLFEARMGGRFRYEHSSPQGLYTSEGYLREFIPDKKMSQIDNLKGPQGEIIAGQLECSTEFTDEGEGTLITVSQKGFDDEDFMQECRKGWEQSLDRLSREALKAS